MACYGWIDTQPPSFWHAVKFTTLLRTAMFSSAGDRSWWKRRWGWDVSLQESVFNISRLDEDSSPTGSTFGAEATAQKHKTSLGIPRWPVDEGMGVALSINVEEPISAPVCPHAVLTETRWETSEWVTISQPNPDTHITHTRDWVSFSGRCNDASRGRMPPLNPPRLWSYKSKFLMNQKGQMTWLANSCVSHDITITFYWNSKSSSPQVGISVAPGYCSLWSLMTLVKSIGFAW